MIKKIAFHSLQLRFILSMLLTSILVGLIVYISGSVIQSDTESRYEKVYLHGKSVLWDKIVLEHLNKLVFPAQVLRADKSISRLLYKKINKSKIKGWTLETVANDWLDFSSDKVFVSLTLIDLNGEVLYSSQQKNTVSVYNELLSQVIKTDAVISSLVRNSQGKLTGMAIVPIIYDDEIIGAGILESEFEVALGVFKLSDNAELFLIDAASNLEFSSNLLMYDQLTEVLNFDITDSIQTVMIEDKMFTLSNQKITDFQGKVLSYLFSANDTSKEYYVHRRVYLNAFILVSTGLLVIWLLMYLFVRRSFNPLDRLLNAVNSIGQGDYFVRAPVIHHDEIGKLAIAFNKMGKKIQNNINKERQNSSDLRNKIQLILNTVNRISEGDLTEEMFVFKDQGAISELSDGIQAMRDKLNLLVEQIKHSDKDVVDATRQIEAAAQQQEATVSEQAASISQVVSTVIEISSVSAELLRSVEKVSHVITQSSLAALEGQSALTSMKSTMSSMYEGTDVITAKLDVLNEQIDKINTVTTTINRVADQTNLLSLNAAIEAEKAGKHGAGFSVVASEIRRLADQTAVATWDIEQMVKEMLLAVSGSVVAMKDFNYKICRGVNDMTSVSSQLNLIIDDAAELPVQFRELKESMIMQAEGANQIKESMIELNEMAKQTNKTIQVSNVSIGTLKKATFVLQKSVSIFKVSGK